MNYSFKRLDETVKYFNLVFNEQTGTPTMLKCLSTNEELQVNLTCKGYSVPLPEWFRSGHSCKLARFSMTENFPSHVRNKGTESNGIMAELNNIQFYQPKGRTKYSTALIRFGLLLRNNYRQTYRLLLEKLRLPSLSLQQKLGSGEVAAAKVTKMLLENGAISEDCALIVDEMYM